MSSQISAAKAKEYINNYRQGLAPGSLRSAWIDRSFIDAILNLAGSKPLDGVRVYLAKYTENDAQGRFSEGSETVIIVPTETVEEDEGHDVEDAYYDYSRVCPPYCKNDEGNP